MLRCFQIVLLLLGASGCGYQLMRADAGGPVAELQLGTIDDLSNIGGLGIEVSRQIRQRLTGRVRPRLSAGPTLSGRIRTLDEAPAGYSAGHASSYRVRVELTLRLQGDGETIWAAPPVHQTAHYLRGPTPLETQSARKQVLHQAARTAANTAIDYFLASPDRS